MIHDGNKIGGYPNAILATVLVIVLPTQEEIRLEIIFALGRFLLALKTLFIITGDIIIK